MRKGLETNVMKSLDDDGGVSITTLFCNWSTEILYGRFFPIPAGIEMLRVRKELEHWL